MSDDPKWLEYARTQLGVAEIAGPKHNPTIIGWAKKLGARILGINVTDDETPWCGLFAAQCMNQCGITPPKIAVRASAWDKFGKHVEPTVGCILRFQRNGGGHVGFYVGEEGDYFLVLGGNQSDKVSITKIAKSRLVSSRWPSDEPVTTKKLIATSDAEVSTNEA